MELERGLGIALQAIQERRPSARNDGGVLWVFSSWGASMSFLTRYDGELREPLVWSQESQVSMRVMRRSP